jgi:D-amino-acid dehydrogenase
MTAWELAERGFQVTVVDRRHEPAAEASFANGAQLSYSYVAPLASPETLRKLPGLLLSHTAPIRIRPSVDPEFIRWGLAFLAACNDDMVHETTRAQLALAALSRDVLASLTAAQRLSFGLRTAGKLVIHRKAATFDGARRQAERQVNGDGDMQQVLSPTECLETEPSLRLAAHDLAGGVYTASDQVGDCRTFCHDLAERLRRRNCVSWQLGTHVRDLVRDGDAVRAVDTSQGEIEADVVVMALGAEAPRFASRAGFRLPIYPMKGYSITARLAPGAAGLNHSVTDFDRKIVYAPLREGSEDVIRVAGIADLVGFDNRVDGRRLATVTRHAADTLDLDLESDLRPWTGLRPTTPDSRPIIGWSPLQNLFLNAGHGALGWTLACGSGRLAAEMITGAPPSVRPDWFALGRHT